MCDIPYAVFDTSNVLISNAVTSNAVTSNAGTNQIDLPISIKIVECEYSIEVVNQRNQVPRNTRFKKINICEVNVCKIMTGVILSILFASIILHLINK